MPNRKISRSVTNVCNRPIVLKKSPGNFFEQISVMSTVQPTHDRVVVDVLDSRVIDLSLPVGTRPEFFNTIGQKQSLNVLSRMV